MQASGPTREAYVPFVPDVMSLNHAGLEYSAGAIHPERVKDQRTLEKSRVNFVMHQMTKPAVNLSAPYVVARSRQMGRRAGYIRAPHPWAGTSHGENLIKAVKF